MEWFIVEYLHLKNKQHPLFHWKISYSRKKIYRFIFEFLKERNQWTEILISFPELQSKEKASSPSSFGVESSQVSTENNHLLNVVFNLTPKLLSKITKEVCIEIGKANKLWFWKNREKPILKLNSEKMKDKLFIWRMNYIQ